jgi:hypothetical protein
MQILKASGDLITEKEDLKQKNQSEEIKVTIC